MEPNTVCLKRNGHPMEVIRAGISYLGPEAQALTRLPAGHPEAFVEAFANLYINFFKVLEDRRKGKTIRLEDYDFPKVDDGVKSMAFIEAAVESDKKGQKWVKLRSHQAEQ